MITKLIILIAGVAIVVYFKTGSGKINRALEDERGGPLTRPIGMLIGAVLGIGAAVFIAKDTLGSMVWVEKIMGWIDQIIAQLIQGSLL